MTSLSTALENLTTFYNENLPSANTTANTQYSRNLKINCKVSKSEIKTWNNCRQRNVKENSPQNYDNFCDHTLDAQ